MNMMYDASQENDWETDISLVTWQYSWNSSIIASIKMGIPINIFYTSQGKHMLWELIRNVLLRHLRLPTMYICMEKRPQQPKK